MKDETKRKLRMKWERIKIEAPVWVGGTVIGMAISGWLGAIINSAEIKKLKKRATVAEHVIDHNADANNRNWALVQEKFEELEDGQKLLMKKAVQETLGDGKG